MTKYLFLLILFTSTHPIPRTVRPLCRIHTTSKDKTWKDIHLACMHNIECIEYNMDHKDKSKLRSSLSSYIFQAILTHPSSSKAFHKYTLPNLKFALMHSSMPQNITFTTWASLVIEVIQSPGDHYETLALLILEGGSKGFSIKDIQYNLSKMAHRHKNINCLKIVSREYRL